MEKIAIAMDGNFVSEHFGRCPSLEIVELENKKIINQETISNPGHRTGFLPEYLSQKGIQVVICGGMGRRAMDLFLAKDIKPIVGISGEVNEIIEKYREGKLKEGNSLCQPGRGKGYGMEKEDHHNQSHFDREMS